MKFNFNLKIVILLLLLLNLNQLIECYFDLFLNSNETEQLFGNDGTLFYVFNGELRMQSISYRLDLSEQKSKLELNWQTRNANNGPLHTTVMYKIDLKDKLNNRSVENAKFYSLDIPTTGHVPKNLSSNTNLTCILKFRIGICLFNPPGSLVISKN
jgi:hypothetical protein